ncbi:MAG: hypothetical protein CL886_06635 [Dehalococcoidia bacterium]|nr:hypothetical protein [Dehalococcoidia bacterium]|tara:strand:- start:6103 stop:8739 length:2637 start_codon:yes stop_codon:yes gene_type:complete
MNEEEYIKLIEATEVAIEDYFKVQGFDVDFSSMTTEEIEEFFFIHVEQSPDSSERFHDYVSAVVSREAPNITPSDYNIKDIEMALQAISPDEVIDFSDMSEEETLEYIENLDPALLGAVYAQLGDPNIEETSGARVIGETWAMAIPFPGGAKLRIGSRLLKNTVGKWLGRLLGRTRAIDDMAPVAGRAATSRTIRETGFGHVDDVAESIKAGFKPGRLGSPNYQFSAGPYGSNTAGMGARGARTTAGVPIQTPVPITPNQAAVGAVLGTGALAGAQQISKELFPSGSRIEEQDKENIEIAEATDVDSSPYLKQQEGVINLNGDQVLKHIYHQSLSDQNIADKIVNYLSGNSVHVLSGGGASLIDSLRSLGPTLINPQNAGMIGDIKVVDLHQGSEGIDLLFDYFMHDPARNIPNYDQRLNDIGSGSLPDLDEHLAREAIQNIANESLYLIIMPDSVGEDGIAGSAPLSGLIQSYDGTPFGDVQTLNDLFPNGSLGPMRMRGALAQMSFNEITLLQQKMLAWGYLDKPPLKWGENLLEGVGESAYFPLERALQEFQMEVNAVGMDLYNRHVADAAMRGDDPRGYTEFLGADGTPHIDKVLDTLLAVKLTPSEDELTPEDTVRSQLVSEASAKITQVMANRGITGMSEGRTLQLERDLQLAMTELDPDKKEMLFGQGGDAVEQALVESLLKEYYGDENWTAHLQFGNHKDSALFDYAMLAGALTQKEREELEAGTLRRQNFRSGTRVGQYADDIESYEKDVATAVLRKFINNRMGEGTSMNPQILSEALNDWQNTVGDRNENVTPEDLLSMSNNALRFLRYESDPINYDPTVDMLSTDYLTDFNEQAKYSGREGMNYYNLKRAIDQLGGGSARGLEVRNV